MRVLIVIPAYNEAENIVRVIQELRTVAPSYDYVVVNDGSSDETAAMCRRNGYHLIDLPVNLGLTGAVQTGVRYALECGYDAVLQLDADGQHDPRYVEEMARIMEEKDADVVIASRFLTEKKPHNLRMLGSNMIAGAIRLTTGRRLTDPTSGMRLWNRRIMTQLVNRRSFRPEPDTVAFLLRQGAKVEEIQVTMRERTAGESYLSPAKAMKYMVQTCASIMLIQWVLKKES